MASGASSTNELDAIVTTNDIQRRTLESLNARLLDKVHELTQIQREMRTALETWPSSKGGGGGGGGPSPLRRRHDQGNGSCDPVGDIDSLISDLTGIEAFSNLQPWTGDDQEATEDDADDVQNELLQLPTPWSELTF